ncbi:MAG TPA: ABC transporter permease, partial [Armatimonadota bacterium]|nr:ABC transporter permease [Armatimonadota bacterium]
MTAMIIRRVLLAIPTLIAISMISFFIIQLAPGDFLDQKIAELEQRYGDASSMARAQELRARYGLDKPVYVQYGKWAWGVLHGDFGESFRYEREVSELIWERLGYTLLLSMGALFFIYSVAIPLGIYSGTHNRKLTDRGLMLASFFGMSMPTFLVALALMVMVFHWCGVPLFGLFSLEYETAPWSWAKVVDLLKHLWIPIAVMSINGLGGLIRIMRANMLDVLGESFVRAARAKGLKERTVVYKHAARIAVNPVISIAGMSLPGI